MFRTDRLLCSINDRLGALAGLLAWELLMRPKQIVSVGQFEAWSGAGEDLPPLLDDFLNDFLLVAKAQDDAAQSEADEDRPPSWEEMAERIEFDPLWNPDG